MNLNLRDVTRTGKDGDRFWKLAELYIRGNTVKYMRVPDKVLDIAAENQVRFCFVRFCMHFACIFR